MQAVRTARKPYWWINGFTIAVFFMTLATILTYTFPPMGVLKEPFWPIILWVGSIFGAAFAHLFRGV